MAPGRERRVPKRYSGESLQRGFYSERGQEEKTNDRKLSSCRCDSRRQSRKASENSPRWNLFL